MSSVTASAVVRQIESLFNGSSVVGLSDRQLIERFTARRDDAGEAAFTALVSRHGPMVMDICRQHLGDLHDAEDAFQAVFLVLAEGAVHPRSRSAGKLALRRRLAHSPPGQKPKRSNAQPSRGQRHAKFTPTCRRLRFSR